MIAVLRRFFRRSRPVFVPLAPEPLCPVCGTPILPGDRYCAECGLRL